VISASTKKKELIGDFKERSHHEDRRAAWRLERRNQARKNSRSVESRSNGSLEIDVRRAA
jgi:hypothetical protein